MLFHSNQGLLEQALIQAAKVGHFNLMKEFIIAGANPFTPDEENHNALYYAIEFDPIKANALLIELEDIINKWDKKGSDA